MYLKTAFYGKFLKKKSHSENAFMAFSERHYRTCTEKATSLVPLMISSGQLMTP